MSARLLVMTGVLAVPGVVAAASSSDQPSKPNLAAPTSDRRQPSSLDNAKRGDAAIQALGRKLNRVAGNAGLSAAQLRSTLRNDPTTVIAGGQLAVVDEAPADGGATTESFAASDTPPTADAFGLHSRPGATRIIYLDVDGHTTENTYWNSNGPIVSAPWDLDGNPNSFNDTERNYIIGWWQQVASDFAPFNVDVTTEAPPIDALRRTSNTDAEYGVRLVISPTNFYSPGTAGVAYLNSFGWTTDTPAFAFTDQIGGNRSKGVADVAAHELGHTFGLRHDGTSTSAYYTGQGDWAPIMGYPLNRSVAQWSKGEYPDANNTEDDLALIAGHAPRVADDHGDVDRPTALGLGTTATGVISQSADVDSFAVPAAAGTMEIRLDPTYAYGALDAALTVTDSSGQTVGSANTSGVGPESVSVPGELGPFVVTVDGVGAGDAATGYSDYGSIGAYRIAAIGDPVAPTTTTEPSVTTTAPPTTTPPTTEPPVTTTAPPTTAPPTTEAPPTTTQPSIAVRVTGVQVVTSGRSARAIVTIQAEDGTTPAGIRVAGVWGNGTRGKGSGTTDDTGTAKTGWKRTRATNPTFTVTSLRLPVGYVWDAA